jgi:nuclear RNA export factor
MGGGVDKMVKTLHVGAEESVKAIMELPSTRHEIEGNAEKFSLDAWPVGSGEAMTLFVTVHGQFVEGVYLGNFHYETNIDLL